MTIRTLTVQITTSGATDIINITPQVAAVASRECQADELLHLFLPGSTAALTTIEFESGAIQDLRRAIERLAPEGLGYEHDKRWGDGNGFAHVRAALLGPSLSIPIAQGRLLLGTWQQIVLCDFDNRPRSRDIIVQVQAAA